MKFLIIGSRGFIGAELMKCLALLNIDAIGSSSSKPQKSNQIELPIGGDYSHLFNLGLTHAIVTSSVTDYSECQNNSSAFKFNTELIPELIVNLMAKGIKVNYLSSNTVFGGSHSWPNEHQVKDPKIAYALQKSVAEDHLLSWASQSKTLHLLTITRLTKVVSREVEPFKTWFNNIGISKSNSPFMDLIFAPITKRFAAENLIKITIEKTAGIFHLSGQENISYYDFCILLYKEMGVSKNLISPVDSYSTNIEHFYFPKWSGLGMKRSSSILNIDPQPAIEVVRYICA